VIIDNSLDMRKGGSHYCSLITAHIVAFQRYDLTDNGRCDIKYLKLTEMLEYEEASPTVTLYLVPRPPTGLK